MGSRKAVFLLQTDPYHPKPVLRALREADSLTRAGWDVAFVSWIKRKSSSEEPRDLYPTHRVHVPVPPIGTSFVGRASAYRSASRHLRDAALQESPNLAIAHDFEVLAAAVAAGRSARVPVIYDSHEDWPALIAENSALEAWIARTQERRLCRSVAHAVTVSDSIAARFRRMSTPVTVLYNARRSSEVVLADSEASRTSFGFETRDFVVGFAGALAAGRGLETLIEALPFLPPSVKALIVGGPEADAARLASYAEKWRVSGRVRIEGYRPFRQLAPYYATMDLGVILLDRRPNHERALPNKLFDYLAHGVPVLVPDYPAMSRIVRNGPVGWTINEINAKAVAETLRDVLASGDTEVRGSRGRDGFLREYAWDRQEQKFLSIASDCVGVSDSR